MPRRSLRCVVDLNIHAVTAPGVWLPSREDVYLSITLFDQYRNTRLLPSVFPLIVHEKFRFEKAFYTAVDPSEIADLLEDELVIFELVQLSEYSDGAIRLASFSINARDFLYPYPSLAPTYTSADRELLMVRTVAFPGISPKIEFSTKTVIKESISPEIDALDDALEEEKERRRSRGRPQSRQSSSVTRARSPSPHYSKRTDDAVLYDSIDNRPPFIVKKLDDSLIGRLPGGPASKHAKSKIRQGPKKIAQSGSRSNVGTYNIDSYSPVKHQYHLKEVIRDPVDCPLPVFESRLVNSDEVLALDAEVAALTSTAGIYRSSLRPRSASPILSRPSFSSRFGDDLYLPSPCSSVADLVRRQLRREHHLRQRLRSLSPSLIDRQSPYSYLAYDLDDLDLDTRIVRSRRSSSLVHISDGHYWTPKAAELCGRSHRHVFDDTFHRSFNNLYQRAEKFGNRCDNARLFLWATKVRLGIDVGHQQLSRIASAIFLSQFWFINDQPPEKFSNPPPEKFSNDPPPEKFFNDQPPEKFSNDPPPENSSHCHTFVS